VEPAVVHIKNGDPFGPTQYLAGVTVTDDYDTDLSLADSYNPKAVNPFVDGCYPVTYEVTDSDGNTTTKQRMVLVGPWGVGKNYAVTAYDFSRTLGQIDGSEAELRKLSEVKVIDIRATVDGQLNPNIGDPVDKELTVNNGGYKKAVGEYKAKFTVTEDPAANISIVAKIGTGIGPELTVPAPRQVNLGTPFGDAQYMQDVKATDPDGDKNNTPGDPTDDRPTDITSNVTFNKSVNTNVVGYYPITYSVEDSDGNIARETTYVFVGPWTVTPTYAISATDFTKRVGQVRGTNSEMINSAKVVAVETQKKLADGSLNPNYGRQTQVIVQDDGGYADRKAGSFPIKFAVQADLGVTRTIKATVTSGAAPSLTVPATRTVPVGASFNYMTSVTATDTEDGNITSKVIHNTPVNVNSAGAYRVTYSVTDSDGNTVTKNGVVLVGTGWVVRDGYALYAQDFARKLSAVTGTRSEAILLAKAMAVRIADASSPDFGQYVGVAIASRGGYKKAAGNYDITFAVSIQRSVKKTIRASISDDTPKAPVINTPPPVVTNNNRTTTIPAPAPAPVAPPVVEVLPTPVPEAAPTISEPPIEITPTEPPLATPTPEGSWHLIDLLFVILTMAFGFYLMALAMRRREEYDEADADTYRGKQIRMWGQLGILLAIVSVIVLLLTQDFEGTMKIADAWMLLFGSIFGVELLAMIGLTRAKDQEWDEQRDI
jgi:hypothetical protein